MHKRVTSANLRSFGLVGVCFLFFGCAGGVKVTAEITEPGGARKRSVAVVSDVFMSDTGEAERVAGLMRDQLASRGFAVKETEEEAELVVIATVERTAPTATSAAPSAGVGRPFDVPFGLGQSSLMESQSALRSLGFEFGTLPTPEQPRVGLLVTAVSRQEWLRSPGGSTEIPHVWRIAAVSRLRKQDVMPQLVEAVGEKLSELTTAPAAEKPTQTPTPALRKKERKTAVPKLEKGRAWDVIGDAQSVISITITNSTQRRKPGWPFSSHGGWAMLPARSTHG